MVAAILAIEVFATTTENAIVMDLTVCVMTVYIIGLVKSVQLIMKMPFALLILRETGTVITRVDVVLMV